MSAAELAMTKLARTPGKITAYSMPSQPPQLLGDHLVRHDGHAPRFLGIVEVRHRRLPSNGPRARARLNGW